MADILTTLWVSLAIVLFILGVISNSLTVAVFTKGKRCPKSDFKALIINLCVADLLLALAPVPTILEDFAVTQNISVCRLKNFIRAFVLFASPYANLAIATQRTLIIFRPAWNRKKATIVVLVLTWCLTYLLGLEILIASKLKKVLTYHGGGSYSYSYSVCSVDLEGSYGGRSELRLWLFFIRMLFPTLSIVILYIIIGIKVYRNRSLDASQQASSVRHRNRILKMFFTVAVVTLVAWFPLNSFYLVLAYIGPYTSDELDTLNIIHVIVKLLVATNTFTSSILYFIFDKHYRKDLATLGCCGRGCSQNDSDPDQQSDESDLEMTQYPRREEENQTI